MKTRKGRAWQRTLPYQTCYGPGDCLIRVPTLVLHIADRKLQHFLVGISAPKKKYLAPPPSPQTFPGALPPLAPPPGIAPPLPLPLLKPDPRPPPRRLLPFPRPGTRKNKKYLKRPPRFFGVSNAALANAALVLSSKNWKKYSRWGAASKNKSKNRWASIFTLSPCGKEFRFSESGILFRRCTHRWK